MDRPRASIIIPAFNEEGYIGSLLEDIGKSGLKDIETIVVDNCSDDRTREVSLGYQERAPSLSVLFEPKKGISKARNLGASVSTGEYLIFLDADSRISKSFLSRTVDEMERRDIDIGNHYLYPSGGNFFDKAMISMMNNLLICPSQYISPSAPGGGGITVKRGLHEKIGGFDESIMTISEDVDYQRRGARIGRYRMLRDSRICINLRRFESEGRLRTWAVWLKAYMYHNLGMDTNRISYGASRPQKL